MATIQDLIEAVEELQASVTILQNSVTDVTDVVLVRKSVLDGIIEEAEVVADLILQSQNTAIIQSLGNISGTVAINLMNGTLITATLTGAVTLSFTGLPSSERETAFTLRFSGIHQINLPVGTKFANGEVPTPEGSLYELPCSIDSTGALIVYGVINDIKVP
jgi:hypothetical protein